MVSDVFRGYRKRLVPENGSMSNMVVVLSHIKKFQFGIGLTSKLLPTGISIHKCKII